MSFYSAIATYYHHIFPFNPQQLAFVQHHAPCASAPVLIEIGAARGSLTAACAKAGYQVTGLELDPLMVQLARKEHPSLLFHEADMLEMDAFFMPHSADTMLCFGNTLVHLQDLDQMQGFLNKAFNTLKPEGQLLVQFINYDRIIDQQIKALPSLSNEDISFERRYELISLSAIAFTACLTIKASGQNIENTQRLYPLRKADFEKVAHQAGFETRAYSSFKNEAWSPAGMQSVFVCTKPA